MIKIDRIIANNTPLSSLLFEGMVNTGTTGTFQKTFDTPISGVREGAVSLFESASPILLTLYGA